MNKKEIFAEAIKIIRKYLAEDYKILLFGSWARGDAWRTSDLDIGILGATEAPWDKMLKIRREIDNIPTLRKIDVVDLNSTESEFKENVLKYAKAL